MDPLSLSVSIIAVLQATSAVVSICYDYSAAIGGSSWELSQVIDEVRSLRNVVETLEQLARQSENSSDTKSRLPSLKLLCEPGTGLLERCLTELADLEKRLRPPGWSGPTGSKRRALAQASGWALKKASVEKSLVTIGRLKDTISLAIAADEAKLLVAIQDTSRSTYDTVSHTRRELGTLFERFAITAADGYEENIREWLSPPDPSSNYNKAREICQPKTGSWFLQSKQFSDWKLHEKSFLWLYGIPGCGKTILSSTIIEDLILAGEKDTSNISYFEPRSAMLYFFFDFNDIDKQSHEKMIRSLILQLSSQAKTLPQPLLSAYESCVKGQRQPTTDSLLEILKQLIQGFHMVFLVIDALDECSERLELLSDLRIIAAWNSGLHILVTSRSEAEIGESLTIMGTSKIYIQSTLVDKDIRAYIRERLSKDWKLRRWKKHQDIQDEIEEILMSKSAGMFRWAVCQLDALGKCLTIPMLRKALHTLPNTLDETYGRILRNIDESWGQSVTRILEWLVFSAAPLHLTEVAELVAINIDEDPPFDPNRRLPEPKDILTMCSSLITMSKEKVVHKFNERVNIEDFTQEYENYEDIFSTSDTENLNKEDSTEESKIIVRLAHFSVKEYLVSRQVQVGPTIQYRILEIPANIAISEICLVYLFQFDRPESLIPETLDLFPLLRYAARNWLTHARIADNQSERLTSMIMTLFLDRHNVFRNWIRVYDPERINERPALWNKSLQLCSPLYYCSLAGLFEPARRLIADGANVNLSEGDLGCSLLAGLKNEHENVSRLLVDSGADVAASAPSWPAGMTALHRAARDGYKFLAAELLSKGAAVTIYTDCGETPLHMSVENGHMEITTLLLDHGANIEAQDNVGKVPLHVATVNKDRPMVEILLGRGASLETRDRLGRTSILIAIETGELDIIQLLLDRAPNMQAEDIRGQTLIHYAAASGLPTIAELQLYDIERMDDSGRTALHVAANAGHLDVVQLLLHKGANIEAPSMSGQKPLHYAAAAGHASVVQQLMNSGADIKAQDDYGASVLYTAAAAGEQAEAVVDLLLEEIERRSKLGQTLLHYAALAGDMQMVKRLIKRGVDLHARNNAGETPLFLAIKRGHDRIVRLLRRANTIPISSEDSDQDETDVEDKTDRSDKELNESHTYVLKNRHRGRRRFRRRKSFEFGRRNRWAEIRERSV